MSNDDETKYRYIIGGSLTITWLVAMVYAFWWFQFQHIRVFDEDAESNQLVFFEGGQLGQHLQQLVIDTRMDGKEHNSVTVVHFWDPTCPCNRFNEVHVKNLIDEYGHKGVKFVVVVHGQDDQQRRLRQQQASSIFIHPAVVDIRSDWRLQNGPPSSPAVAIMDKQGELAYFGPYSVGAVCTVNNGAYVETVLEGLEKGATKIKQLNTMAVGCFCDWQPA